LQVSPVTLVKKLLPSSHCCKSQRRRCPEGLLARTTINKQPLPCSGAVTIKVAVVSHRGKALTICFHSTLHIVLVIGKFGTLLCCAACCMMPLSMSALTRFCVVQPLYDTFENVQDHEGQHMKNMAAASSSTGFLCRVKWAKPQTITAFLTHLCVVQHLV